MKNLGNLVMLFGLLSALLWQACGPGGQDSGASSDALLDWVAAYPDPKDSLFAARYGEALQVRTATARYDSAAQLFIQVGDALTSRNAYDSLYLARSLAWESDYGQYVSNESYAGLAYNIGVQYQYYGEQDSALYWYAQVAAQGTATKQLRRYSANARIMRSMVLLQLGRMQEAMEDAELAQADYQAVGYKKGEMIAIGQKGRIYHQMSAHEESERYHRQALALAKEEKDTSIILASYFNINLVQVGLFSYQSDSLGSEVLPYADSVYLLCRQWSQVPAFYQFYLHYNLVYKYVLAKDLPAAARHLDSCRIASEANGQAVLAHTYTIIKTFYDSHSERNLDLNKTAATAKEAAENGDFTNSFYIYNALYENALNQKKYVQAIDYLENQHRLRDSLWNQEVAGKVFALNIAHQTAQKEQQIALKDSQIKRQNWWIATLGSALVALLALLAVALLIRQSRRLRQKRDQQQQFTAQLFAKIEEERQRIAKDLHDSLSHDILLLKQDAQRQSQLNSQRFDDIINNLRQISRDLHPVLFERVGLANSLEQLAERLQEATQAFVAAEVDYPGGLSKAQELQVYRIAQEALNNAIKHAEASAIKLDLHQKAGQLLLEIRDNGKGFDAAEAMKSGKAFGLFSIAERCAAMKGSMSYLPATKGSHLLVSIPNPL